MLIVPQRDAVLNSRNVLLKQASSAETPTDEATAFATPEAKTTSPKSTSTLQAESTTPAATSSAGSSPSRETLVFVPTVQDQRNTIAQTYDLSPRETEIFLLLAQGRSRPYIRDALFLSKNTVATHIRHIYEKMDIHSQQELIDVVQEGYTKEEQAVE